MDGVLVTFAREELLKKVAAAEERVWLASPFLGASVAVQIAGAAAEAPAGDLRMLTALVPRSVQAGVLSITGLSILRESGFEIASIPNLHAKVCLTDSDWGLVGSGNLTGTGLDGDEGGNVELGVVLSRVQRRAVSDLVAGWWEEKADPVGAAEIEAFAALPKFPRPKGQPPPVGRPLGLIGSEGLERILTEDGVATERRYWIKSNYHRPGDEQWWHRNWISDWRQAPYEVGDLVVLYLSARDGGPACCPAVAEVTAPSEHDPEWVIRRRDAEAAERWPYVTKTRLVGEVPITAGAKLAIIGKNGQSVQGGYCKIDRSEFELLVRSMLGIAR